MKRFQGPARRATPLLLALAAAWTGPTGVRAQEPRLSSNAELERALGRLRAERGADLRIVEIGRSAGGAPLSLVRVGGRDGEAPRPALLVVAGAHGPHAVGTEVALALLDSLLAGYGRDSAVTALLDRSVVLVAPRLNPDAAADASRRPLEEPVRNAAPRDDDRDGEVDEDGPDDLDGNGIITWMRIADPAGTWIEDPEDPGLMRPADPARGDRRAWKLMTEGRDDDGDGKWNEDPRGGVDPAANFPHDYEWFGETTGDYPLSAPESRALAELLAGREEIAAVVVLGTRDNLAAPWKAGSDEGRGGGPTDDGDGARDRIREPLERVLAGDAPWFEEISRRYRERTGRTEADSLGAERFGGDPVSWAYYHMGRWAFGSAVWTPPKPEAPGVPEPDDDAEPAAGADFPDAEPVTAAAEEDADAGPASDRKKAAKEDPVAAERRALRWIRANRPGDFVDWRRVEHPDFPDRVVEVGGFVPMARWTPPAAEREEIARGEVEFLIGLAASLPRLALPRLTAESLGDGAWRITARVANEGFLPTRTELAARLGRPRAIRVSVEGTGVEVVGGRRTQSIEDLPGGGAEVELSWVVVGARGRRVTVRAEAPAVGDASAEVELR
ncbi:MAG: M14 family zinc carboxypeptidase [Gemmatimonadota bacterium]